MPTLPGLQVELHAARIPVIGAFAHHHWFVVEQDGVRDRWEVWQTANAGGIAYGHVHRNLWPPERGVGNGPGWVIRCWSGHAARELIQEIEASPTTYPWREFYLPFPGPNSNTYVQWLLGERFRLGRLAPGRAWARWPRRKFVTKTSVRP